MTLLERRAPVSRVADWLGCSTRHVRKLVHIGELEAIDLHAGRLKLNGEPMLPRWAVSVDSVRRFLEARAHAQKPPKTGTADIAGAEGGRR